MYSANNQMHLHIKAIAMNALVTNTSVYIGIDCTQENTQKTCKRTLKI